MDCLSNWSLTIGHLGIWAYGTDYKKLCLSNRQTIGSLSKDVFERRTSTGSEAFSLFICLDANKFVLLSFFSLIKTIYQRVSTKPLPNDAKSPLPVDIRRSKTPLFKLLNSFPVCTVANAQSKVHLIINIRFRLYVSVTSVTCFLGYNESRVVEFFPSLRLRANGRNNSQHCCAKNVGSCWIACVLAVVCKRMQHCCATLRRSRSKRNVGSFWLKSVTGFKLCATTRNNIQQHATRSNGRNM